MTNCNPLQIESPVLVLVGPTAIGKTALSFDIVREFDCEIISMDSMQVYRHMDIGTAKPTVEERKQVRHHLIDVVLPDEQYNAARFVSDCLQAIQVIASQGKIPLITGGTGLYLSSLINGLFEEVKVKDEVKEELQRQLTAHGLASLYKELCSVDPVSAARIHRNDKHRIIRGLEIYHSSGVPWSDQLRQQNKKESQVRFTRIFKIGLTCERTLLHQRIEQRSSVMLEQGLVEEAKGLRKMGYAPSLPSMGAIGYRHVNQLLDGQCDQAEMVDSLVRDTRRYAKRQMTWFRRHKTLHWYQRYQTEKIISDIKINLKLQ